MKPSDKYSEMSNQKGLFKLSSPPTHNIVGNDSYNISDDSFQNNFSKRFFLGNKITTDYLTIKTHNAGI